jgi:hypothetical protein
VVVKIAGQGTLVAEQVTDPVIHRRGKGTRVPKESPAGTMHYGTMSMRGFNATTGVVYEVSLSEAMLEQIRRVREARGLNNAVHPRRDQLGSADIPVNDVVDSTPFLKKPFRAKRFGLRVAKPPLWEGVKNLRRRATIGKPLNP